MAFVPAQKPGDHHPKIPAAKKFLSRYSYGKDLGVTDEYTVAFGIALMIWQPKINAEIDKGRSGPRVNMLGVFDWAVQKQMGLLEPAPPDPNRPWIITVGGHLGTWDTGPAYWCAQPLEQQGKVRVQGVGYDAASIPFNNKSGYNELDRIVTQIKPDNVPWAVGSHSQGAIIVSDYLEQKVLPNQSDPSFANFRGGVQFGNPRRPMGVTASWIADPPPAGSEGLSGNCLRAKLPGVEECSRKGDLYSDKTPGPAAEYKTAIYQLIAEAKVFGVDSLFEQLLELGVSPFTEMWPVVQALIGAIGFGINMDPHNVFDLWPAQQHFARILA